jgi:hypothetical protein
MTALRDRTIINDVSAGIWRDSTPELVPPNGLFDLRNGFLNYDGTAYKRGGTSYHSNATFGGSGRAIWDLEMEPGQRTVIASASAFGVLDVDDATPISLSGSGVAAPVRAAYLNGLLFLPPGYIYGGSRKSSNYPVSADFTHSSAVVSGGTGFTANVDAGMLLVANAGERAYVVKSVDSNTQVTLTEPYEGSTAAGVSAVFYKLLPVAAPYPQADIYCVHANRLITAKDNVVTFTDIGKPHSTPTFNFHVLPEGVTITGLESIGTTLLVFTNAGIWRLLGMALDIVDPEGNPNHQLVILSRDLTLWSPTGIAAWQQALIVPCIDGVYLMDGVSAPQRISRPIHPIYVSYVLAGLQTGQAVEYDGHYFLPIIRGDGTVVDLLMCYLDRPTTYRSQRVYPWSRADGHFGTMPAFAVRSGAVVRQPKLLGISYKDGRVADCGNVLHPGPGFERDADNRAPIFDIISRELPTGALTKNSVREMRARYELLGDGTATFVPAYSLGETRKDVPLWDEVNWDEFNWAGDDTATSFKNLPGDFPESDGVDAYKARIGKRARYIRLRLRCWQPTNTCKLREMEMFVRPSGSVRS